MKLSTTASQNTDKAWNQEIDLNLCPFDNAIIPYSQKPIHEPVPIQLSLQVDVESPQLQNLRIMLNPNRMLQPDSTLSNLNISPTYTSPNQNHTFPLITLLPDQPLSPRDEMTESNYYEVENPLILPHQTNLKQTRP